MKKWLLTAVVAIFLVQLVLTACTFARQAPQAKEAQRTTDRQSFEIPKSAKWLRMTVAYYRWQMKELREARREDLIRALGQDVYEELREVYQKGGNKALMDKIPELFTRNEDPYAVRYHSVYDVFRYRSGRCGEESHFAIGILYLFGVQQLEIIHSTADHVWLEVGGNHYDPGLVGKDRYNKDAYREWAAPFGFILAIDIYGNVRDVTAEYIKITLEVMERRKQILNGKE